MDDVFEREAIADIHTLLAACEKLVGYFKRSELNNKLSKSLKQHVKTRWNSVYYMLESVYLMKSEIQRLLIDKNVVHKMAMVDFNLIDDLLKFLSPFKECSEELSAEKYPTINEYVLWYKKLSNLCSEESADINAIAQLKSSIKMSLLKRFKPEEIHYIALFLNPPFKELKFCDQEKKDSVYSSLKCMAMEIRNAPESDHEVLPMDEPSNSTNRPFFEYMDISQEISTPNKQEEIDDELRLYLKTKIKPDCQILNFWKAANHIPLLQKIATYILCIPCSSATSERVFSTSGRILEERRSRLLGENVDKILFLHKNA